MRFFPLGLTAVLLACGSSSPPDVCQQTVSLVVAQQSKAQSCVADAGPGAGDGGTAVENDLDAGLKYCEANLKSCRPEDIAAWQKSLDCEQALLPDVDCKWYTEANPFSDPSYYAYSQQLATCTSEFRPPSPACANAEP